MVSSWWTFQYLFIHIFSHFAHSRLFKNQLYNHIFNHSFENMFTLMQAYTKDIRMTARGRTLDLTELSLGENPNSNLISSVQKPMVLGSMPCRFRSNHILFLWNMKWEYERSYSLHSLSLGVLALFLKKKGSETKTSRWELETLLKWEPTCLSYFRGQN